MGNEEIPDGTLFSRAYLSGGPLKKDSSRFRTRLAAFVESAFPHQDSARSALSDMIARELGVEVPLRGPSFDLSGFFKNQTTDIRDVLDSITLIERSLRLNRKSHLVPSWRDFVSRVFREEGLGYRLDPQGGVRCFIDEEFERNRFSMISSLSESRWAAVRHSCEAAYARLDSDPQDKKAAVRDMFEAVETACKLLTNSNSNLSDSVVKSVVLPWVQTKTSHETGAAQSATGRMVSSLGKWADAGHPYRHGSKSTSPTDPSLEFAVLYLSQGASFIRWLLSIEGRGP